MEKTESFFNKKVSVDPWLTNFFASFLSSLFSLIFLLFLLFSPVSLQNVLVDSFGRNYINVISGALILFGIAYNFFYNRQDHGLYKKFEKRDYNEGVLYYVFSSLVFGLAILVYYWAKGIWFILEEVFKNGIQELFFIWLLSFVMLSRLMYFFVQDKIQKWKLVVFYILVIFSFVFSPYSNNGNLRDLFSLLPIAFIVIFDLLAKSLPRVFSFEFGNEKNTSQAG